MIDYNPLKGFPHILWIRCWHLPHGNDRETWLQGASRICTFIRHVITL